MSCRRLGQQQVTKTRQANDKYKFMIGQIHVLFCKTLSLVAEFNEALRRKKLFVPCFVILLCFAKVDGETANTNA